LNADREQPDYAFPGVETSTQPNPPAVKTGRYDIDSIRRAANAPKGGDVAVGTMSDFLMDPSDIPGAVAPADSPAVGANGLKLDVAKHTFGDKAPERVRSSFDAPPKEPDDSFRMDADAAVPLEGLVTMATGGRYRFLLTRVLPIAGVLLVAALAASLLFGGGASLQGEYQAVFSDTEGREVTCQTRFMPRAEDRTKVYGLFTCKLYMSEYSINRVDEPQVLKPIMGDGTFSYNGQHTRKGVELKLGSLNPDDTRTVAFHGDFKNGTKRIVGRLSDSLSHEAKAEIIKLE
jgi:hypothetical protein